MGIESARSRPSIFDQKKKFWINRSKSEKPKLFLREKKKEFLSPNMREMIFSFFLFGKCNDRDLNLKIISSIFFLQINWFENIILSLILG